MKYLFIFMFLNISFKVQSVDKLWGYFLDKDLSKWKLWMGGAHSSIKGLPENTHICDSIFSDVRAYLGIAGV